MPQRNPAAKTPAAIESFPVHCRLRALVARFPLSEPALLDYLARKRAFPR